MITKVSVHHDPKRRQPWIVRWFGDADPETRKQRRYSKSFKHAREAKAFQVEQQADLNRGAPRDKAEEVTLGRLLNEFTEARLSELADVSRAGYRNTMDQLRSAFGDGRSVETVARRQAETFLATRKRQDGRKGQLSSWSKMRHLINCRAVFNAAVSWGYIEHNPFKTVTRGNTPLRVTPKSRPWHHLTPDEFRRLLGETSSVRRRACYWLMYGAGLRPGEAYNITVDRIDLEHRRVHVANRPPTVNMPPFAVKADERSSESKARSVPLPEAAIPAITEAMQQAFRSGGFLLLTPERFATVQLNWRLCRAGKGWAGHPYREWRNADMVNSVLRDAKAGLKRADMELIAAFTLTTFRKSFAQNHADAGTPPKTLAKLLGHANTRITMEYYNRATDANERAAAATMDRILSQPTSTQRAQDAG